MADENETKPKVDGGAENTEGDASAHTTGENNPPAPVQPTTTKSASQQPSSPIDVDAELNAKELLADKLQAGVITYEDYAKQLIQHDRRITQAQRQERLAIQESVRPIQQAREITDQNRKYFAAWGKNDHNADKLYGKTVLAKMAEKLFNDARDEYEADPMYANNPNFDANTVIRMKWMEKLATASKKPSPSATTESSTQLSGGGGAGAQAYTPDGRTARQKLDAGEYSSIVEETERLISG